MDYNTNVAVQQQYSSDRNEMTFKRPKELFESGELVKICAPMVRYSKLPFRALVRKYGCDLAFTPMIVANSFVQSIKARDSDFTTNSMDRPLIVQFAANNSKDFADAAEIVYPYSDGIDLNCGCPQRWAMQEGYGSCLLNKPDQISEIVTAARDRVQDPEFSVSVKIRLNEDIKKTVALCQQVEKAGVSWIAVHGRTPKERCQPVNLEGIRIIKENVHVPVVANGDICSLEDAVMVKEKTGVNGVMAARGILANPAMYSGYTETPLECVKDWLDISLAYGCQFSIFHHHLIQMLDTVLCRAEKRVFNSLTGTATVLDFLKDRYGIEHGRKIESN